MSSSEVDSLIMAAQSCNLARYHAVLELPDAESLFADAVLAVVDATGVLRADLLDDVAACVADGGTVAEAVAAAAEDLVGTVEARMAVPVPVS